MALWTWPGWTGIEADGGCPQPPRMAGKESLFHGGPGFSVGHRTYVRAMINGDFDDDDDCDCDLDGRGWTSGRFLPWIAR